MLSPGCAGRGSERSAEFGSVNPYSLPSRARARLGRHDAARPARSAWSVQRQLAARFDGEVAGGAVADSVLVISGSGRRWSSGDSMVRSPAVGAIDDDDDVGFGERRRWWRRRVAQLRGHRQRSPNSPALTVGRLAMLSPGCAGRGSERSAEFGSVNPSSLPSRARARLGRHDAARPARSAWSVQRQLAARFDGEVAGGAVADSVLVIFGSGRRWSSGDSMVRSPAVGAIDDDDDVGFGERRRWWRRRVAQLRGHRQRSPNSPALTVGRLAMLSPGCAGRGSERSAEFGSVYHLRCPHARAHNRETRRLLTNRPCSAFSTKSPHSKGRLRVSNGLCKDSMIMQSRRPSNSDF